MCPGDPIKEDGTSGMTGEAGGSMMLKSTVEETGFGQGASMMFEDGEDWKRLLQRARMKDGTALS